MVDGLLNCLKDNCNIHCMKIFRIRNFSGQYFPAFGLNTDEKNAEYGHFLHGDMMYTHKQYKFQFDRFRQINCAPLKEFCTYENFNQISENI